MKNGTEITESTLALLHKLSPSQGREFFANLLNDISDWATEVDVEDKDEYLQVKEAFFQGLEVPAFVLFLEYILGIPDLEDYLYSNCLELTDDEY